MGDAGCGRSRAYCHGVRAAFSPADQPVGCQPLSSMLGWVGANLGLGVLARWSGTLGLGHIGCH